MKLVLIGGGGHARVVAEVATAAGHELLGVLTPCEASPAEGLTRLGDDRWIEHARAETGFHIAFGPRHDSNDREAAFSRLAALRLAMPALVSPAAQVSQLAEIGDGTLVVHGAIVNAGATLGVNVIVNSGAIVEHDCAVGRHSHVAPGAILAGSVQTGERCLIGAGAVILPGLTIADRTVIGAGAVVAKSIADPDTTWSGNPARRHR